MLSEERIEELATEWSADAVESSAQQIVANIAGATQRAARFAATNAALEAAAAERERLMEVVSWCCGRAVSEFPPGTYLCPKCEKSIRWHDERMTRAEYLRLHPEAGEGG